MPQVYHTHPEAFVEASLQNVQPLPQEQCPLYSKLSAELRSLVFSFTLQEFEDKSKPYRPNRLYYRPGHHYHTNHDTKLVQTCRLIYQEARMIPVARHTFTYWFHGGPVQYRSKIPPSQLQLDMLTTEQLAAVQEVHLFAQQCCLEYCHPFSTKIQCKKFKITIRHSDWWSWDSPVDSPDRLGICPWRHGEHGRTTCDEMEAESREHDLRPKWDQLRAARNEPWRSKGDRLVWGYDLQFIEGLEILEMELETEIRKKSQLENVVEIAKCWRIPMGGDRELRWTGKIQEHTWIGVADLRSDGGYVDEQRRFGREETAIVESLPELVTDVADIQTMPPVSELISEAPMREYYVVTMSWGVRQREDRRHMG
jgi:hypothetical protein